MFMKQYFMLDYRTCKNLLGFDDGAVTFTTFMNFRKAFECWNNGIFLAKLPHYRVSSDEKNGIKRYLLDRRHLVDWKSNYQQKVRSI